MKTWQDLAGTSNIGDFCLSAVSDFMASSDYAQAQAGEAYYNKHNITIEKYQKFLFTLSGNKVPDVWSSNYKLKTQFFRRLVTQQVQYVLGNGLTLQNVDNKAKLGADFDFKLQTIAKKAMAQGKAFAFWNLDHLEIFGYADTPTDAGFCPLYDENTAELKAGIRYYFQNVDDGEVFRCTLFEADGYTDYIKEADAEHVSEHIAKRPYKTITKKTNNGIIEDERGENYTKLPIICVYANDTHESELVGIRECIDCYDFIKSGLANVIDDNADIFWVLQNTGGMDDTDLAQFIQRMRTVRGAIVDETEVSTHAVDVPYEARKTMLEILRKDIYEDFQALDVNTLSAAAKTTQEIQAAYQSQDNKCADFEYYMLDFVQSVLEIAGINDTPSFVWNRVVNQTEQTQMILSCAEWLTEDMILKKLPFLTPEDVDFVLNARDAEDFKQFNAIEGDITADNNEGEE